jgi:hypothetical protein
MLMVNVEVRSRPRLGGRWRCIASFETLSTAYDAVSVTPSAHCPALHCFAFTRHSLARMKLFHSDAIFGVLLPWRIVLCGLPKSDK